MSEGNDHAAIPVRRYIAKYSLRTERLQAEFDVTHLPLEHLQRLYPGALPHDPLLYEGYRIGPEQAAALQPHMAEPFDFEMSEYLMEAYQAEDAAQQPPVHDGVHPVHVRLASSDR